MNKIILLGHASAGLEKVEALLLASGMQPALPSQRDNLMPADIVQTLCQAHQIAEVNEVLTEDDFAPVKVGAIWNGLAVDLILGNLSQPIWGLADSRNIYWLDFWASLDPNRPRLPGAIQTDLKFLALLVNQHREIYLA